MATHCGPARRAPSSKPTKGWPATDASSATGAPTWIRRSSSRTWPRSGSRPKAASVGSSPCAADVKSPYGNELSAADVEWGWNKSFAQKRTGNFIAAVANVTAVKALSAKEVEFTLSAPSSIFLACLTLYTPSIYDSTEVKKHVTAEDPWALDWMQTHTAGYGPYTVDSVRPGEQATFVANPGYFRAAPFFGRVIYRAVPSPASVSPCYAAATCSGSTARTCSRCSTCAPTSG